MPEAPKGPLLPLALSALGVVYGDIGTSPLYTVRECFFGIHPVAPTVENVLGVLSLVFWSLTMVVSFKYLGFILRADNHGEGGIFALLALLPATGRRRLRSLTVAALLGAALLYGDGVITPAISVLSAVEGLAVATDAAQPFVVPLVIGVLFALFWAQRHGTGHIGTVFGPAMLTWFLCIAALGIHGIVQTPQVLRALNPLHAIRFFSTNGFRAFLVLGAVVLAITGAEALYADLGHFGRRPIRLSWFAAAFPALLLNYFGQGAVLLQSHPSAAINPFYALVPRSLLVPMVLLATVATIIASQALISGAFSLTSQAVQLGFLPRFRIVHTSGLAYGQIYVPTINWLLMVACIGLVLGFQESSRLAAAYGVAVTANMAITSVLYYNVSRLTWRWPLVGSAPLVALFLVFDLAFFGANVFKVAQGGWFPIAVAVALLAVMTTWRQGRAELAKAVAERTLPLDLLLEDIARTAPRRVPGTAVFMSSNPKGTPPSLLHHFKHNRVFHERVVLLSMIVLEEPAVPIEKRVEVEDRGHGFYRLKAYYGFMESPNVPELMELARAKGLATDPATTSYFLGRESLVIGKRTRLAGWKKRLFRVLSRNAEPASAYFGLPPGRVVELGMQIEL